MVTVYSKPKCPQCDATKRALDKKGVAYTPRDVTLDADAYSDVEALGYRALPVVVVNEENHWSGFRPDLIQQITK